MENSGVPGRVRLRLLALCGIISPISLFILGGVAVQLRPGFNSVTQFGSELGVGTDAAAIVARSGFAVSFLPFYVWTVVIAIRLMRSV